MQVYRDVWGAFTAWCLGQSPVVTLASLDGLDLHAFQAARFGEGSSDLSLSPRYALRFMRLIDRVSQHHAFDTGSAPNMAAAQWLSDHPEARYAESSKADPLPEFLSVSEARVLITFLSSARPPPGVSKARRDGQAALSWQDVRNRVAVATQLGAGLTPGDVRGLVLTSPVVRGGRVRERPWKLSVPGDGNSAARETPVAPWAGELLHHCCRSGPKHGSWGTGCFQQPVRASSGARKRSTRLRVRCWKTRRSTARTEGRSGCGTRLLCGSCDGGQSLRRWRAGWGWSLK